MAKNLPDPEQEAKTLGWKFIEITPRLPGYVDFKIEGRVESVRSLMARTLRAAAGTTEREMLDAADALESPIGEDKGT